VDDSSLTVSEYTPAALTPARTYYWRVKAFNEVGGSSAWSSVRSFRTVLTTPVISAPVSGTTPDNLRPVFDWSDVGSATNYTIQVSKYSNLSSPLINTTASSSTYTPTRDLPANVPLYWRARANHATYGPSAWATGSFTSPKPPPVPSLLTPASGILFTVYDPVHLTWKLSSVPADFDHYSQVSNATPTAIVLDTDQFAAAGYCPSRRGVITGGCGVQHPPSQYPAGRLCARSRRPCSRRCWSLRGRARRLTACVRPSSGRMWSARPVTPS
jgi:hypothetical protein